MSNQKPERAEFFDGSIFGEEWLDPDTGQKVDMPSVETGRVFIPKAWREKLGFGHDD